MQYILTEAEYRELTERSTNECAAFMDTLQELCTKVADHMPVTVPWAPDAPPKPWGCILTSPSCGYCDGCPVQDVCPHPHKAWSQ